MTQDERDVAVLLIRLRPSMGQKASRGWIRQSGRAPLRSASLRAERKALWRDSDTVPAAGIDAKWYLPMTQDEKWQARYKEVVAFIEINYRNPSKHRIEEHDMLNWLKANRKRMNADGLKPERVEKFKELLALMEEYRRVNQWG